MKTANAKGLELETAVRQIEEAIIKHDPALSRSQFKIRSRHRVRVADVLHELDLSVLVCAESGYDSLHVFECKNWKKPVGKNEVIVFAAKIDAVGAVKGYIVAHKFTRDAFAEAALHPRLYLIECRTEFTSPLDSVQPAASTSDILSLRTFLKLEGDYALQADNFFGVFCWTEKRAISLAGFTIEQAEQMLKKCISEGRNWEQLEGLHVRRISQKLTFGNGEFLVAGVSAEWISFNAVFAIHARIPDIVSKFDIETRGRVYKYEAPATDNLPKLTVDLVQTQTRNGPVRYTWDFQSKSGGIIRQGTYGNC